MRIVAAILALASAGATLTASTVPAFAEEPREVIVHLSDLNLAAPAGRATLDRRVRAAARKVCGALPAVQLEEVQQVRACQSAAMAQGWNQVTATASSGQIRRTR
jgi:UrcA family protein